MNTLPCRVLAVRIYTKVSKVSKPMSVQKKVRDTKTVLKAPFNYEYEYK